MSIQDDIQAVRKWLGSLGDYLEPKTGPLASLRRILTELEKLQRINSENPHRGSNFDDHMAQTMEEWAIELETLQARNAFLEDVFVKQKDFIEKEIDRNLEINKLQAEKRELVYALKKIERLNGDRHAGLLARAALAKVRRGG